MKVALLVCALCSASLLCAEDGDFLTPNEADQVRQTQEPNARLELYIHFASQRLDLLHQDLAGNQPGRAVFIHHAITDYSSIIDAINAVSDDALLHKKSIDKGLIVVAVAEKNFLDKLQKIEDSQPKDLALYKFVLEDAIDATSDSRNMALESSGARTKDLVAAEQKQEKERESMMGPQEVARRKKAAQAQEEKKKKIPSLYRPGEKHTEEVQ
ncbi:MAG TPA: hypothetical protein VF283_17915 [Bryobacteraceae bacterium]